MKPIISLYVRMYVYTAQTHVHTYVCTYACTVLTYVYADVCVHSTSRSLLPVHSQLKYSWRTHLHRVLQTYIRTYICGLTQCYTLKGLHILHQKERWRLHNWHHQMWYSDVCVNVYRSSVKTATVCTCTQLKLYCWQGMTHVHSVGALCSLSHKDQVRRWAVRCVQGGASHTWTCTQHVLIMSHYSGGMCVRM